MTTTAAPNKASRGTPRANGPAPGSGRTDPTLSPGDATGAGASSTLDAALALAARGWRVVALHSVTTDGRCSCRKDPCPGRPGKHPRTVHGLRDGTTDPATIRRWWTRWPAANVAVCTGPESGVWMLGPDGQAGIEALAELERQHGPLPRTPTVRSGSGGRHYYFRWPADGNITNRKNHRGLPIDVRGAGGYAVAPPSRNPAGEYVWEISPAEREPAEAPDWLLEWCRTGGKAEAVPTGTGPGGVPSVIGRVIAYLDRVPPAISGQGGHAQTMTAARAVVWGFDLGPEVGYQVLAAHYNPRCEPPWSERELRHKCSEADTVPYSRPRGYLLTAQQPGRGIRPPRTGQAGVAAGTPADRPVIVIRTDEHRVVDDAVAALGGEGEVYQRGGALVAVRRGDDDPAGRAVERRPGAPRIVLLPTPTVREVLTRAGRWVKERAGPTGDIIQVPAHPPDWAVAAVAARGHYPGVRTLRAVIEAPTLRGDGTVLDAPGYDPGTGLLYQPSAEYPAVPVVPTVGQAADAADQLLDLVGDFPFAAGPEGQALAHRAAWLAALLTPLARHAIAGPCPLFLMEANTPGSGKSLLCDLLSVIVTGRGLARTPYVDDDREMNKCVTSIALAGDPMILLDNVASALGGSSLDAALTGTCWKGRVLGRSEMTAELPLHTTWYATANNATLRGDVQRRIVLCRLESPVERPEERDGFRVPDLLGHAARERPRLVAAALTILRGYTACGRPHQAITPLGGYEAWSDLVRSAVVWATGTDPCATRQEVLGRDTSRDVLAAVIEGWAELCAGGPGLTVAQAVQRLSAEPGRYATLRDALRMWSRTGEHPSPVAIGGRLRANRGRVVAGRCLESIPARKGQQIWVVRDLRGPDDQ